MPNAAAVGVGGVEIFDSSRLSIAVAVVGRVVAKEVRAWVTKEREFSGSGPDSSTKRTSGMKRCRAMASSVGDVGELRRMDRKQPAAILPRPRSLRQSSIASRHWIRSGWRGGKALEAVVNTTVHANRMFLAHKSAESDSRL